MKTMRVKRMRTILAIVVALLLLLSTSGLAKPEAGCSAKVGIASGGGYHLTELSWRVSGSASGGEYHLIGPAVPSLRGSGCCCTYLPMGQRNAR